MGVLRRRGLEFRIVYLRREYSRLSTNADLDELMRRLFDRIIGSRRGGEDIQARKLFQFIRSIA